MASRTIRGMHSGFIPRVFEASYKATLFRLRQNHTAANRAEAQLAKMLDQAHDSETAPAWWKTNVREAAERGRVAGKEHFGTFGQGARKNINPFRPARRKTTPAKRSRDPEDFSSEAEELLLFLDNDEPLYRRKKEFLKNVYTKMKRGTYSPALARKLWMYYVEEAAKKYEKEFLNPGEWHQVFPPAVRREVAKELEERERRMIESGEYRDFPPVRVLHDPGFRRRGAPGSRRKPG